MELEEESLVPETRRLNRPPRSLTTTEGIGISCLKSNKWLGYILNELFLADTLKGQIGWSSLNTRKNKTTFLVNNSFKKVIKNMSRTNLRNLVANRHSKNEAEKCSEDESRMIQDIYRLVYRSHSPISLISLLEKKTRLTEEEQIIMDKYFDTSKWAADLPVCQQNSIEYIYTLEDLYLITASIQEESTDTNSILRRLNQYKTRADKIQEAAITSLLNSIDTKYLGNLPKYSNYIEPGTHIGYTFMGGAIHHGVYIGNNTVVELINLDTKESNKNIKPFIALTHIFEFIKRARNSASGLLHIQYNNTYPLNIIKKRALWMLGRSPYHLTEGNCESFVSWVMSNNFVSSMCIVVSPEKVKVGSSSRFLYLPPLPVSVDGGRRTRKRRN